MVRIHRRRSSQSLDQGGTLYIGLSVVDPCDPDLREKQRREGLDMIAEVSSREDRVTDAWASITSAYLAVLARKPVQVAIINHAITLD